MHTTHALAQVPAWPVYVLTAHEDGHFVASGPLVPASRHLTRAAAVGTVAAAAARLGRPVRAQATEQNGTVWNLVVSPDGAVGELPGGGHHTRALRGRDTKSPPRSADAAPEPEQQPERGAYAEPLALVAQHLEAGREAQAAALTVRLDEEAADRLGVSHPDALHIREVRARVTALAGDVLNGVRLSRDVAERWHHRGEHERAEAAATYAETLWMGITDVDTALSVGIALVRLRHQIPGESGGALGAVLEHQAWLTSLRDQSRPQQPRPVAPVLPGRGPANPARLQRSGPSWERPAQGIQEAT
ncbi:hypothetical protein AB0D47_37130 [Streptomyces sp. NPDC048376]|uniref:hypothetical protein n=1 Tax=unclassified Streptomyces TaxID=2593676 RepID=UPI00341B8659